MREEGLELENGVGDLEKRLRMYNEELDVFLSGGGDESLKVQKE